MPDAGLTGGVAWHDAQRLHADRLLLACIEDAAACGAEVANHVAGEALLGTADRVESVRARCTLSGDTLALRARVTVNACGPFAPGLLQGTRAATDLRGTLTRADQWFDEMHPTEAGFHALATKFRGAVLGKLPAAKR